MHVYLSFCSDVKYTYHMITDSMVEFDLREMSLNMNDIIGYEYHIKILHYIHVHVCQC